MRNVSNLKPKLQVLRPKNYMINLKKMGWLTNTLQYRTFFFNFTENINKNHLHNFFRISAHNNPLHTFSPLRFFLQNSYCPFPKSFLADKERM